MHFGICRGPGSNLPQIGGMTVAVSIGLDVPKVTGSLKMLITAATCHFVPVPLGNLESWELQVLLRTVGDRSQFWKAVRLDGVTELTGVLWFHSWVCKYQSFSHVHKETCGDVSYTASVW